MYIYILAFGALYIKGLTVFICARIWWKNKMLLSTACMLNSEVLFKTHFPNGTHTRGLVIFSFPISCKPGECSELNDMYCLFTLIACNFHLHCPTQCFKLTIFHNGYFPIFATYNCFRITSYINQTLSTMFIWIVIARIPIACYTIKNLGHVQWFSICFVTRNYSSIRNLWRTWSDPLQFCFRSIFMDKHL